MTRARRPRGEPIDWAAVRARLARAQAATAAALELPPERVRALMDERARALARPPAPRDAGEVRDVLAFALGVERYAIETRYAREVVRLTDVSPVPGAPDFLRGVTNLRGDILCLVDLRKFFDVSSEGLTDRSRCDENQTARCLMVVMGIERAEFGILVDETFEIARLRPDDIVPPPAFANAPARHAEAERKRPESVAGVGREYLLGITRKALIVLDGAALLRDPRLYVNQDGRAG